MSIIQTFNLNLIPTSAPVVVHVDQYDHGTGRLRASLFNNDTLYSPSGTAVIQGTKPDGKGFEYSASISGNVVTANLTEQMTAVAGPVRAQIVVTESSGRTGTFVFILDVQKSALPADTDMSESEYQKIEEALETVDRAIQAAEDAAGSAEEAAGFAENAAGSAGDAADSAEDAEAWAKGTRNGSAVPSSDPTYHNNSRYFSGVASDNATQASRNGEAWAVGTRGGASIPSTDPAYNNYAKYWAEQAEQYAQGGLKFEGTIYFAELPTSNIRVGAMYNIKDAFTTDSRFEEGAGVKCPEGSNVAWTPNNKWDVLAGYYQCIVSITQAQFDQLTTAQKNDPSIWWWISDADGVISGSGSGGGVTAYPDLTNKPQINGHTLIGNMSSSVLEIGGVTDYDDLTDKPKINGHTLSGNKSGSALGLNNYDDLLNKPSINGHTLSGAMTSSILEIGGVTNYNDLSNRPQINGHTLTGNQSAADLGIGGGASNLNDLSDVTVTTPSANQILRYTGSKWQNASPVIQCGFESKNASSVTIPAGGKVACSISPSLFPATSSLGKCTGIVTSIQDNLSSFDQVIYSNITYYANLIGFVATNTTNESKTVTPSVEMLYLKIVYE